VFEGVIVGQPSEDRRLVEALRRGEEDAFSALLDHYYPAMMRLALAYVHSRAVAEEVVQETWLGLLQGLARFEFRSSLQTWIFRILTNRAKTRGQRESRYVPLDSLGDDAMPEVPPERFGMVDRHWVTPPRSWVGSPEETTLAQETHASIQRAITTLPLNQRVVITLRDMEGWTAAEVCHALELSAANQRVLLHRARSTVRRALEECFTRA